MPETVIKHHIWPLKVMFSNRKMPEAPNFDEEPKSIFLTCRSKIVAFCIVTKYHCNSFRATGSYIVMMYTVPIALWKRTLYWVNEPHIKIQSWCIQYLIHFEKGLYISHNVHSTYFTLKYNFVLSEWAVQLLILTYITINWGLVTFCLNDQPQGISQ